MDASQSFTTHAEQDLIQAVGKAFVELLKHQQTLFEQQRRSERELDNKLDRLEKVIMAAIDDLKTNIGALIAEGTADITALVQSVADKSQNSPQGGASEADLQELAANVAAATSQMHQAFLAATGTSVPATSSSGASSNATDTSAQGTTVPPAPETPPATSPAASTDTPAQDPSAGVTTIGPGSFKSGA